MRKTALALSALACMIGLTPLVATSAEAQVYRQEHATRSGVSYTTMVRHGNSASSRSVYYGRNGTRCVRTAHAYRTPFGVRHVARKRCY